MNLPGSTVSWREGKAPLDEVPVSIALGIFDGVHRGHQAVIASALESANAAGGIAVVLTFTPHPSRILRPEKPTLMLFSPESKRRRLYQSGVEAIVWKRFDEAFAQSTPDVFAAMLPKAFPTLVSLHVGENFRFGRQRAGTPALLRENLASENIRLEAVPRLEWNNAAVSSTRLREVIADGCMEDADTMLGTPYRCSCRIASGRKLGTTIGFPTFNLPYDPELRPRFGVYAVEVSGTDGKKLPAVANYGLRPTVERVAVAPLLEVHLLREVPDWKAGDTLTVEWSSFIRPETRFDGLEALKAQIEKDVVSAEGILGL